MVEFLHRAMASQITQSRVERTRDSIINLLFRCVVTAIDRTPGEINHGRGTVQFAHPVAERAAVPLHFTNTIERLFRRADRNRYRMARTQEVLDESVTEGEIHQRE